MNKTWSKAKGLLMNSRLMKEKENQEEKNENPVVNPVSLKEEEIKTHIQNSNNEISKNLDAHQNHENLNKSNHVVEATNPNTSDVINKKGDTQSFKSKITDRLAFFQLRKPNIINTPIEIEKPQKIEHNTLIMNYQDKPHEKTETQHNSFNKPIINKTNLLDRFIKNDNKEPIKIKIPQSVKIEKPNKNEKEIEKVKEEEKAKDVPHKEEKQILIHEENEIHYDNNHEKKDTQLTEVKLTSVQQDKLMKRMISAKSTNPDSTKEKDLGKNKASIKIMGLASMFIGKLVPKDKPEDPQVKQTYLLTNDADIQLVGDEIKQIPDNKTSGEPESQKRRLNIERKSVVDIMLEKPMNIRKATKKREPKVFKLKEDS
jgi:hypothetical protein